MHAWPVTLVHDDFSAFRTSSKSGSAQIPGSRQAYLHGEIVFYSRDDFAPHAHGTFPNAAPKGSRGWDSFGSHALLFEVTVDNEAATELRKDAVVHRLQHVPLFKW